MEKILSDAAIYLGVALAISEALSQIPSLKENSILDVVKSVSKKALELIKKK